MKDLILRRKWWIIAALILAGLLYSSAVFVRNASERMVAEYPDYEPDVFSDVVEIDGVLYFPDGTPVRNYEQLYIYENSK